MEREEAARPDGGNQRTIAGLVRDLAEGSAELVRQEVRLVRLELGSLLASVARGTVEVASGSVLILLGGLAVIVGLIALIGEQWLVGRYWAGALIVSALAGVVAALVGARGARLLSPSQFVPERTTATLKEDKEWLKQQMRSGATSR